MKEFWSYWKCFREHYFCGFPNLCCWKALETDIQATLMDRGWSPLFYGFPKPKALSVFLSYGPPGNSLNFGFLPSHFSNSISSMVHRGSSRPAILGNWWGEDRQFSSDLASSLGWGRAAQADVDSSLWWEDPGGELTQEQKLIRACSLGVNAYGSTQVGLHLAGHGIRHFISLK